MSGFVVLHRAAIDHHLFEKDPAKLGAWVWMIARACWKQTKFNIRGKTLMLERGQFCASVRQIAEELGWSKSAVDRFLSRLETETMIKREAGHGRLIITICNYAKYQDVPDVDRDKAGTETGTKLGQSWDIKEQGNKGTIEQERETNVSLARETCKPVIDAWNHMANQAGLPKCEKFTDKRRKSCLARLKSDGLDAIMRAIERIPCSSFLRGETGSWSGASFDFLMRPDTVTNILEGKYDDRAKQQSTSHSGSRAKDGAAAALDRQLGLEQSPGSPGRRDISGGSGNSQRSLNGPSSLW